MSAPPGRSWPRFVPSDAEQLTDAQRSVAAEVRAGRRGTVPANVQAWLPSPELARRAARLGELLRYETSLPPSHSELAILLVARHWACEYEWAVHAVEAARAGVPPTVIEAIGRGRAPGVDGVEAVVAEVTSALLRDGRLSDTVFQMAEATLGRQALVELTALVGYYTLVAMTLNTFEVPVPEGAPRLPSRG